MYLIRALSSPNPAGVVRVSGRFQDRLARTTDTFASAQPFTQHHFTVACRVAPPLLPSSGNKSLYLSMIGRKHVKRGYSTIFVLPRLKASNLTQHRTWKSSTRTTWRSPASTVALQKPSPLRPKCPPTHWGNSKIKPSLPRSRRNFPDQERLSAPPKK